MKPPVEVWRCAKCGLEYPSPVRLIDVKCPRHPTGRRPKMTVVAGEQTYVAPGRLLETSGPSDASTSPARDQAPTQEALDMGHGTRSARRTKAGTR